MACSSKKEDFDILRSQSSQYQVLDIIGSGSYGKVARCLKVSTPEEAAVKIMKNEHYYKYVAEREVGVLKQLNNLNLNQNFVHFVEVFNDKKHICLVFEMLDRTLLQLMQERVFRPLPLPEIRVITKQLLVSLNVLKDLGFVHTDIKPDNIMLVNHKSHPFKVKLIDFGLATPISPGGNEKKVQALGYRAPEVIWGAKWNEPIDMWSVGCVAAFLYTSRHLYPTRCEYDTMRVLTQMHGLPDSQLLSDGIRTHWFFTKTGDSVDAGWRLNTEEEYKLATGLRAGNSTSKYFSSLDDIVKIHAEKAKDDTVDEDINAFLSLLKQMLCVDPRKRITPSEALTHCFVTMTHFTSSTTSPYVTSSRLLMNVCQDSELTTNDVSDSGALTGPDGTKDAAGASNGPAGDKASAATGQVNKQEESRGAFSRAMRSLCCCCEPLVED